MAVGKHFVCALILILNYKYGLADSDSSSSTTSSTTTQSTSEATTKKTIICKNNEVASSCVNRLCQYTNCTQLDQPIVCVESSTEVCEEACICKDKYLRADNGTCIPFTECPNYSKCTKENESYDLCPAPCLSRECGVSKLNTSCSYSSDNSTCVPACICKVGFYRNYDGNCVVESLCGSNSSSSTTSSTETTQSTSETTASSSTTALTTTSTTPKTTTQSNTSKRCGKYERYRKNPCTLCQPFTCSQVGYALACVQSNYSQTCSLQPGCYCINGYVKNDSNICVPVKKCPSCGGDVNAESGCTVVCPTCEDYYKPKPTGCSKLCKLNGCGCKKGYAYDSTQKRCVLLQNDCSPKG